MAVNKVIYGDKVIIDISDSTVTAENLAAGAVAYSAKGEKITGTKSMISVLSGTGEPTTDIGSDGDIYLVTG